MKNALIYNYNIYIENLQKINENYYFNFQNDNYVLSVFNRDIYESIGVYKLNQEMLNKGLPTYRIVLTKNNNVLFLYDNVYYILMIIPKIKNRIITINDVLNFNYVFLDKDLVKLDKSNWLFYWENKIDYIENQFFEVKSKYPLLRETINYYIGMWENGISYLNYVDTKSKSKFVCHRRLKVDTDMLEFLNPINLIIDYKERDISEYLKSYIFTKNWTIEELDNVFSRLSLNKEDAMVLISRTLFPSYYFDLYEDIILDNRSEEEINDILINNKNIIYLLKYLFRKYQGYNIPLIDWIIKEE